MVFNIPNCRHLQNIPFYRHVELWKINSQGNDICAFNLTHMAKVNLKKKKYLWSKSQKADLNII